MKSMLQQLRADENTKAAIASKFRAARIAASRAEAKANYKLADAVKEHELAVTQWAKAHDALADAMRAEKLRAS